MEMGLCDHAKPLPNNVPICYRGKNSCFLNMNLQSLRISILWSPFFHPPNAQKMLFKERRNHTKNVITVKVSRQTQKVEIYLACERSGFAFFGRDSGHFLGNKVDNENGVALRGKGLHKSEYVCDIVLIDALKTYLDLIEYVVLLRHQGTIVACFPFNSKV